MAFGANLRPTKAEPGKRLLLRFICLAHPEERQRRESQHSLFHWAGHCHKPLLPSPVGTLYQICEKERDRTLSLQSHSSGTWLQPFVILRCTWMKTQQLWHLKGSEVPSGRTLPISMIFLFISHSECAIVLFKTLLSPLKCSLGGGVEEVPWPISRPLPPPWSHHHWFPYRCFLEYELCE